MATKQTDTGATTGYETELWAMADALRGSMDAAGYKHVVLGLIFLKYISDAFEERHATVLAEWGEEAAEIATSTSPRTSSGCRRTIRLARPRSCITLSSQPSRMVTIRPRP